MINQLEKILKHVSENILKDRKFSEQYKTMDIVTNKDIEAERYIIKSIKDFRPDDQFISEEENQNTLSDEPTWIIDPIDGTLNYTRNIPQYGIQLALYEKKEPVLSMMYFPENDTLIHAIKGQGFFINHKKKHVGAMPLSKSIITFGDFSKSQPASRETQIKLMSHIMNHVMKVRIYGASSTDFGYVAMGMTQAHFIFTSRIWEMAAGILMVKEAGLSVRNLTFENCSGLLIGHEEILEDLNVYIKEIS